MSESGMRRRFISVALLIAILAPVVVLLWMSISVFLNFYRLDAYRNHLVKFRMELEKYETHNGTMPGIAEGNGSSWRPEFFEFLKQNEPDISARNVYCCSSRRTVSFFALRDENGMYFWDPQTQGRKNPVVLVLVEDSEIALDQWSEPFDAFISKQGVSVGNALRFREGELSQVKILFTLRSNGEIEYWEENPSRLQLLDDE